MIARAFKHVRKNRQAGKMTATQFRSISDKVPDSRAEQMMLSIKRQNDELLKDPEKKYHFDTRGCRWDNEQNFGEVIQEEEFRNLNTSVADFEKRLTSDSLRGDLALNSDYFDSSIQDSNQFEHILKAEEIPAHWGEVIGENAE